MPRRFTKRRGQRLSVRSRKRRRTSFRGRRRTTRPNRFRTRTFKRFRRRFNSIPKLRHRRRRTIKKKRQHLQFIQAPERIAAWEYGQAAEVANSVISMECRYFVTEVTDSTKTADTITTRGLGCLNDILNMAEYAWDTIPTTADAVINTPASSAFTGNVDGLQGTLWVKGNDLYTLRNQTNEAVTIQAFYVKCRKDWNQNEATVQNMYRLLGRGFAERGYDSANAGAFNGAMTLSSLTPFDSPLFCRLFKVKKVEKFKIGPGQTAKRGISMKWRPYSPINYVIPAVGTTWTELTAIYEYLKGEQFILFRLFSNIGMATGQPEAQFSRDIGQTDPLVIMSTTRRYHYKHLRQPPKGLIKFITDGIVAGDDVVIMAENTMVEQKEAQAE